MSEEMGNKTNWDDFMKNQNMNNQEIMQNEEMMQPSYNNMMNQDYSNGMNNQNYNNNGMNNQNYNNGMNNQNYNNGMNNNGMNSQNYNNGMNMQNMNCNMGNQMMAQNYNNDMSKQGMNYNMNQMMNFGNNSNNQMQDYEINPSQISEYKMRLRGLKEVQDLTSEVDIQNSNSIVLFGQGASENISKISDELLNSMKAIKAEETSEMLVNLTKLMEKFDVKEIEGGNEKPSILSKFMKGMGNTVAKLFQKYDTMGMEVEKIYVLLKRYESEIKESNAHLKKLYDGNIYFYQLLEKYIVAGEMAMEEIDGYLNQIENNPGINREEKQMMIQKLQIGKDMLSQRVYDLQVAENVAIQAAPMIQTIQMSNFNLMRKINSSFIVTLPIFKQCLAQAIILKRQEIQAKSIKQLDDKTNELIMRNATNTARQSVEIAKMSSGSSIAIQTLEKSYETIMKGIEETKSIQEANRMERQENSKKLEVIKHNMKKNISMA